MSDTGECLFASERSRWALLPGVAVGSGFGLAWAVLGVSGLPVPGLVAAARGAFPGPWRSGCTCSPGDSPTWPEG
jgi:hypothetical protein